MKDPRRSTDEELAARMTGGVASEYAFAAEQAAFAEFYSRHAQRSYHYILRFTGDPTAAEDILQEVFLKFQTAVRQHLVPTNPGAYLMMIARNLSLNWIRDSRRIIPIEPTADLRSYAEEQWEALLVRQDRDELLHLITLALEVLEPEYREAFVLKYYQSYTYDEMTQLTGETIATLRNRVWRAKERIKLALKPYIQEHQEIR